MPKYIQKQQEIEALQWTGDRHREMFDFLTFNTKKDSPMETCGDHFYINHSAVQGGLVIIDNKTNATKEAIIGDYVVKRPDNTFYVCHKEIFEKAFELIKEEIASPLTDLDKQRIENAIWILIQYRDDLVHMAPDMKFDESDFESAFKTLAYIQANMEHQLDVEL